jgi:hypothetical protein
MFFWVVFQENERLVDMNRFASEGVYLLLFFFHNLADVFKSSSQISNRERKGTKQNN